MESTIYVKPERIRQYVIDLFGYYHVSKADAAMIADNLIDAEIRGVTTHGLTRIPLYTEKLISGLYDAKAVPEIVKNYGATALIDAHDGLGQVAATKAMELAIEKAEQFGVGYVGLRNGSHYGTAGYYAMMAEKRGMIGFSMTNSGAFVAPFGGVEKRLGTNPSPLRFLPKSICRSCSTWRPAVSRAAKLLVNMKKGEPVPDDWALAIDGSRTTDAPQAFRSILLPLGYKGYGMAVIVDMLSGVLNGSGFGVAVDTPKDKPIVGSSFLAIKTEAFCEQGELRRNVDALIDEIKNVKLEAGTDEVLMPGEIEFRAEIANRKKGGVPIQPFQISELNEQAAPFGFTFEEYL